MSNTGLIINKKEIQMPESIKNIKSDEMKLNKDGSVQISDELLGAIAGGLNPEDQEDEGIVTINGNCGCEVEK